MKNKRMLLVVLCIISLSFVFVSCGKTPSEPSFIASTDRYEAVSAPIISGLPPLIASSTDNSSNFFLFDGGYVSNTPIVSGHTVYFNGQTPINVRFEQSTVTEQKVEEAMSKTITQSISQTSMNEVGVKVTVGSGSGTGFWGNFSVEASYSRTWGATTENANSTTSTYLTAESKSQSLTQAIDFTVGEHRELAGDYRLSMMATTDVYYMVTTNRDNSELISLEVIMCARPEVRFVLEYTEAKGNFNSSDESEKLSIPNNFLMLLPFPTVGAPGIGVPVTGDTINFAGGYGTAASPYLISTPQHFRNINSGNNNNMYYKLINSLSLGTLNNPFEFNGNLNGNGYTITYSMAGTATGNMGLFSVINSGAISNLCLDVNMDFNGWSNSPIIGGLAGKTTGNTTLSKISVRGIIRTTGNNQDGGTGGLVGRVEGSAIISESRNTATIISTGSTSGLNAANTRHNVAGGIVGWIDRTGAVTIENCYNEGAINVGNNGSAGASIIRAAGGIVGNISSTRTNIPVTIISSYNNSTVTADRRGTTKSGHLSSGAIVGDITSTSGVTLQYCYFNNTLSSRAANGSTSFTGAIGLNTAQMSDRNNFIGGMWNDASIWNFGIGAPRLAWMI